MAAPGERVPPARLRTGRRCWLVIVVVSMLIGMGVAPVPIL